VVRAELALAAAVSALGVFLLLGVSKIRFGAGYDRIGPRFFPYAVAAGLIFLGCWLAVGAIAGGREKGSEQQPLHWAPLAYLTLGLILNLALLDRAGFIVASTVQFWLAAHAFHSRRPLRDAVVAVVVSVIVYVAFSEFLGLTLPAGPLESFF
jgi:putative tricarboxylic transport membrane protein